MNAIIVLASIKYPPQANTAREQDDRTLKQRFYTPEGCSSEIRH
ncbi:hypothetical protein QUB60_23485 [Microcoleus sp. A2-C5]|nr:hypothetical protein [Lyngbya sp. CCAP 1446/10]